MQPLDWVITGHVVEIFLFRGSKQTDNMSTFFPYWAMLMIIAFYIVLPPLYFATKERLNKTSPLTLTDYYVMCFIMLFLVTGGYQLYFWCQKAHLGEAKEVQKTKIDHVIPKVPEAIYLYNFLYYIGFGLCVVSIMSYQHFVHLLVVGLGLLCFHAIFFLFYPTKLPSDTRHSSDATNPFMRLTQSIDQVYNAFPSAHVSIAILIYFVTRGVFGPIALLFPVLITLSCLLTKQHFVVDCGGGVLIAIIYIALVRKLYPYDVFK